MKIKIIKCSFSDSCWYSNRIGEEHEVWDIGGEAGDCYGIAIDSISKFWYVLMTDCEIIKNKLS